MSTRARRVLWRVVAEATPRVARWCARCDKKSQFVCTERFRINASGGLLDTWLIYRCEACSARWNCGVFERRPVADFPPGALEALQANDQQLAWRYAFDGELLKRRGGSPLLDDVPYSVESRCISREEGRTMMEISVELVFPLRVRLDRLLASQLGISRATVTRMYRSGELEIQPAERTPLRRPAKTGQRIMIA